MIIQELFDFEIPCSRWSELCTLKLDKSNDIYTFVAIFIQYFSGPVKKSISVIDISHQVQDAMKSISTVSNRDEIVFKKISVINYNNNFFHFLIFNFIRLVST